MGLRSTALSLDLPPEVVCDEGVNLSVLHHRVLERVALRSGTGCEKEAARYPLLVLNALPTPYQRL
jgi:hypothetical protein